MLSIALECLSNEWSIIPVCTPIVGQNRCIQGHRDQQGQPRPCRSPGKEPLVRWTEFQMRMPEEREIRQWWSRWPSANIGLVTGALSGICVIDIDGEVAKQQALRLGFELGPWVLTGRVGGRHLYFRHRDDAPTIFASAGGIDFRGEGGFVLLPPSLHSSGNTYKWGQVVERGEPLPPLPRWVDDMGGEKRREPIDSKRLYETGIPEGEREITIFRYASKLRGEDIPYPLALEMIYGVADRCRPPFDRVEARLKVDNAYARYVPNVITTPIVAPSGHTVDPATGEVLDEAQKAWGRPISELLRQPETEVDWLVDNLFSVGSSGFIAAEPKVGKSWIGLELAYCLSTGTQFLGRFAVKEPRRVLFIEEEDSERRMLRRFNKLLRGVEGRTWPSDENYRFAVRTGFRLDDPTWLHTLHTEIADTRPDMVILDVFNKLHLKDENNGEAMSEILHALGDLTREFGCAFIIIHHYRKSGGMGQSVRGNQMLRGHSSLAGFAECSLFLRKGKGKNRIVCEPESKDASEIEEFEIRLEDVPGDGTRLVAGDTDEGVKLAMERLAVLDAIDALVHDGKDAVPNNISEILGWERTKTSRVLNGMVSASLLDVETVQQGRNRFRFYSRVQGVPS